MGIMRISQIAQLSNATNTDLLAEPVFHIYQDQVSNNDRHVDPEIVKIEQKGRRKVDMFTVFQGLQSKCLEINAVDTTSPQFQLQFKGLPEAMIHLFLRHHIDFNKIECHKGRCTCSRAYGPHCCADAFLDCMLSAAHNAWSIFSETQRQEVSRTIKSSLWQAVIASRLHIDNRFTRQQMTSELQPFLSTGASATPAVLAVLQDYFTVNIIIFDTTTEDFGVIKSKHFRHFRPYMLFVQKPGCLTLVRERADNSCWTWSSHKTMLREIVKVPEITAASVDLKSLSIEKLSALARCLGHTVLSTRAETEILLAEHQFTERDYALIKPILSIPENELSLLNGFAQGSTAVRGKHIELEVRFGLFTTTFMPDVGERSLKKLIEQLHATKTFKAMSPTTCLKTYSATSDAAKVLIVSSTAAVKQYINAPLIPSSNMVLQRKKRLTNQDNHDHGYRISISEESTEIADTDVLKAIHGQTKHYRYMMRYSFLSASERFRMDLSVTKSSKTPAQSFTLSKTLQQQNRYEIELEHVAEDGTFSDADIQEMYRLINFVLKHVQDTYIPISLTQQQSVTQEYMTAFWKNARQQAERKHFLGVDNNSMSMVHLLPSHIKTHQPNVRKSTPEDYTLTEKADGERHLLFVTSDETVYLINNRMSVKHTGLKCIHAVGPTLIDGEYVNTDGLNIFLAFDILFHDGTDVRSLALHRTLDEQHKPKGRLEMLRAFLHQAPFKKVHPDAMTLKIKQFYAVNMFDVDGKIAGSLMDKAAELWQKRQDLFKYYVDGLIFTPRTAPYPCVEKERINFWKDLLKWKPRQLTSIDFLVRIQRSADKEVVNYHLGKLPGSPGESLIPYKVVHLYVGGKPHNTAPYQETLFSAESASSTNDTPTYLARIEVGSDLLLMAEDPLSGAREEFKHNMVVEFVYDLAAPSGFQWKPIRVRHDKTQAYWKGGLKAGGPNSIRTATSIWNSIHEMGGLAADASIFSLVEDAGNEKRLVAEYFKGKEQEKAYYSISENRDDRRRRITFDLVEFHNKTVKQSLYRVAAELLVPDNQQGDIPRLLDLGCGKGGDYPKYKATKIRKVYAVDKDKTGLDELKFKRHLEAHKRDPTAYPREVITIQADMGLLLSSGSGALNQSDKKLLQDYYHDHGQFSFPIISCQFSMHYCMGSELAMRTFMMNIYENLQIGGIFIATALDGKRIFDELKKRQQLTFLDASGQKYADVHKSYTSKVLKPWGLAIDVTFESISQTARTEYLVDFDRFAKIMTEDFDVETISDEDASSLGLPKGTANFDVLYDLPSNNHKMSSELQSWSFSNKYIVMRKTGTGNAMVIKKWLSLIHKAEHK